MPGVTGSALGLVDLDEIEGLICNLCLNVAARTLVRADPSLRHALECCWDVKQANKKPTEQITWARSLPEPLLPVCRQTGTRYTRDDSLVMVTNDLYFSMDTARQSLGGQCHLMKAVVVVVMVKVVVVVMMMWRMIILCWSPTTSTSPWTPPDSLVKVSII